MNISVFGLGYVGCVLCGCLKKMGHEVIGVDIVKDKVELIKEGEWPIYEPGLDALLSDIKTGRIIATTDTIEAVLSTDISFVCVGTPTYFDSGVDLSQINSTIVEIGTAIKTKRIKHDIVIRSTIPPGTTEENIIPLITDNIGLKEGIDFTIGYYPEFLREGSAINDFFQPSLNVIGLSDGFDLQLMKTIFHGVKKEFTVSSIRAAEMIKYACNSFHGLKVTFANEIGTLCNNYNVDGNEVMSLFTQDTILNLSPTYLTPGFAYGGSCLPKELRALTGLARAKGVEIPLIKAIENSNKEHINRLVSILINLKQEKIGFLGVTFKPFTDDIRESPVLNAINTLLNLSTEYKQIIIPVICDNEKALQKVEDHYNRKVNIVSTPNELIERSDIIVLGTFKTDEEIQRKIIVSGKTTVDLKWHNVTDELLKYENYITLV